MMGQILCKPNLLGADGHKTTAEWKESHIGCCKKKQILKERGSLLHSERLWESQGISVFDVLFSWRRYQ